MTNTRIFAAALLLCTSLSCAAAQNAPAAPEPPPVADKGTTVQLNCIDEAGETRGDDSHLVRTIKLTNKCEQRLRCQAYAAAFGAQGVQHTRAVLILAPKSKGAAATKTYTFRIKENGGMLTSTRHCRVI
jgi:Spy/CpxP family protein refolding chaperone